MKVAMISLGCSKNLIDSEQMLYKLDEFDYEFCSELDKCEAAIVNTCGFIDEAKQEAIDNILELAEHKKQGTLKAIIVTGCMAERFRDEIFTEIPEVDAIVGVGGHLEIAEILNKALQGDKKSYYFDINAPIIEAGRIPSSGPFTAYIKIAEGCDNCCAYCVIPSLRGSFRSRKLEDIIDEAKALADGGIKEIILIAQDITRYGVDIYKKSMLSELLEQLCEIKAIEWIRLHYMYPSGIDDELIEVIAKNDKILKYIDIPVQHINNSILKNMNRRYNGNEVKALISKLRSVMPEIVLRTSVIVGLPGEGEEEFCELCEFLKENRLERVGVFAFSPQEKTRAAEMENQVDDDTKNSRKDIIMEIQEKIMADYRQSLLGKEIVVLCEEFDRIAEIWFGRTYADSPEIDGKVFFTAERACNPGDFVTVKITETEDELLGVY